MQPQINAALRRLLVALERPASLDEWSRRGPDALGASRGGGEVTPPRPTTY